MKVTKSQLKQIIKEEIEGSSEIIELLKDISYKLDQGPELKEIIAAIDRVDGSLDYVASALTGMAPGTIGSMQKALGRYYSPPTRRSIDPTDVNIKDDG
tara:strand:- start:352 stop:648 length:297 start_codon:yes stop_codon:yes gene_type:complete